MLLDIFFWILVAGLIWMLFYFAYNCSKNKNIPKIYGILYIMLAIGLICGVVMDIANLL